MSSHSHISQSNRIEFIDLAKGVCIILIVAGHCGLSAIPGLESWVIVSFYFLLSGLFFKIDGGIKKFIIKKTNQILVPFIFFAIPGLILYSIVKGWEYSSLLALFQTNGPYPRVLGNGALWFLISLFNCGLMFAIVKTYVKSTILQGLVFVFLGAVGLVLSHYKIRLPLFLASSFTAIPFYWAGYYLKQTKLLYKSSYDKYNLLFFIILYAISYLLSLLRADAHFDSRLNIISIVDYPLIVTSLFALLFLCKAIKHLPIVSYIGRYSLVVLCTHMLVLRSVEFIVDLNTVCLFLITLTISTILIPICIKYFPYFTAQKDLIKITK